MAPKAVLVCLSLLLAALPSVAATRSEASPQAPALSGKTDPAGPVDPASAFTDGDSALVKESLDQTKIHAVYNNGDFEPVILVLEGFIKRNKTYSHSDSVFIAKHLAVMYSANPATRERGKYYMYRLLELLPSAKLVDMYVSEEVDRIFDRVREEFMARQRGFGVDTSRISLPERPRPGKDSNPGNDSEPKVNPGKKGSHWVAWTLAAGGGALVTGTYLWIQSQEGGKSAPAESVDVRIITPRN